MDFGKSGVSGERRQTVTSGRRRIERDHRPDGIRPVAAALDLPADPVQVADAGQLPQVAGVKDCSRLRSRFLVCPVSRPPGIDCGKGLLAHRHRWRLGQRRRREVGRMQPEIEGVLDSFRDCPARSGRLNVRTWRADRGAIAAVGVVRDGAGDQFDGTAAIVDADGVLQLLERLQRQGRDQLEQLVFGQQLKVFDQLGAFCGGNMRIAGTQFAPETGTG